VITFKGYAKLGFTYPGVSTTPFFINQDVAPQTLALKYDATTKDKNNNLLSAGIHISPVPDAPAIYTTMLTPKKDNKDITLFNTSGIVAQAPTGEYIFGNEKRIRDNVKTGNILTYDDKKGTVKAEGKLDLGAKFGLIKTAAAGSIDVKLDSGKYKINMDLAIDPQMDSKMQDRFEFYMVGDDADQPDLTYDKEKPKKAIYSLADEDDDKKLLSDFEQTSQFIKRPKAIKENLVFTDVNFVFDPDDVSLRSVGKIGVAMVGKKTINKKLEGYIEIQYKGGNDVFTIYLQTGTKGWIYFEYRPGALGILSSYDDINNALKALAPDKRKIKGSGKAFYTYTPASPLAKEDFVSYMKDKAAGINRVHPAPREPMEEIPVNTDTSSIPENSAPLPGDTLSKEEQKQQDEINEINQMKSGGGGVLSGPPPGRKDNATPPAEEPAAPKMDAEQKKEQEQIKETEQLKNSGGSVLSGAPPDRKAPPAQEPVKQDTVPAAAPSTPVPSSTPDNVTPVQQTAPQTTPDAPKSDAVTPPAQQSAPAMTPPTPDAVKKDTVPAVAPMITPDIPKQDTTATPH